MCSKQRAACIQACLRDKDTKRKSGKKQPRRDCPRKRQPPIDLDNLDELEDY